MKKIVVSKRYLIPSILILSLLFLLVNLFWPERQGYSQIPPPPPPVPVQLVPSVLEDIRNTKHNLSSIGPADRAVYTQQTTEICVFCHTPHGSIGDEEAAGLKAPLWNRGLSTARYILYDQVWSTSFEAYEVSPPKPNAPTGYSRLCLSCHDGTIALGTVLNPPGSGIYYQTQQMIYPTGQSHAGGSGTMPAGSGVATGDTRVIGTNLQNDHPISFVYDSALALRDEELVDPGPSLVAPARVGDPTPISPARRYPGADLFKFDSVQCTSCHNPHAAKFTDGTIVPKFLRANYYNEPENPNRGKIICLYCHEKPGWSGSSHDAATFTPPPNPSSVNAYNFDGSHTVGKYACRACHDPHTAQGAKRLLREGTDFNNNEAIENTCYLCHKPASELGYAPNPPPDIRSEFFKDVNLGRGGSGSAMNLTMAQGHEPVFVSRPQEGVSLRSLSPPPFNEYAPGSAIQDTVHVECVDCHNPHQVSRTNRLKGMKGIDINGNVVGAKIPGNSREPYVHEVCLRCHGDSYFNLFVGSRDIDDLPFMRRSNPRIGLPSDPNLSLKGYSNKRKEFDPQTPDIGAGHTQQLRNPAFHPVGAPGRNGTQQLCNQLAVAFNLTSGFLGVAGTNGSCDTPALASETLKNITITCTDCHNNDAFGSTVTGPITGHDEASYRRGTDKSPTSAYFIDVLSKEPSTPQGPHGSKFPRILRNQYKTDIFDPPGVRNRAFYDNFLLCFQCHDRRAFDVTSGGAIDGDNEPQWTNFNGFKGAGIRNVWTGNLHKFHISEVGAYCAECHYNVHSNVEATNTIYGNGLGGDLPDDSEDGITDGVVSTHLINFAPEQVVGVWADKPKWFVDSYTFPGFRVMRCYLGCHGIDMNACSYALPTELKGFQCQEGC